MPLYAASSPVYPDYSISARVHAICHPDLAPVNGVIAAVDTLYLYPFIVRRPISFSAGRLRVTTGGAGSSCKAGIWANSTVSMRPLGAPLFKDDTGVATTSSSTNAQIALVAGVLTPGLYWFGSKYTGTLPTVRCLPITTIFGSLAGIPDASAIDSSHLSIASTYSSAMPTLAEGAGFSLLSSATCPLGYLLTA